MFNIGPPELMLVGLIALLLFGKRVPEVMRSLGRSVSEFQKGLSSVKEELSGIEKASR